MVTGPTTKEYSATLGGYILKDKLWFFLAGRDQETSSDGHLLPHRSPRAEQQHRGPSGDQADGQLPGQAHRSRPRSPSARTSALRPSFSFSATPDTLRTRTDPADLTVARYTGVLTPVALRRAAVLGEDLHLHERPRPRRQRRCRARQSFIENSPFFDFFGSLGRALQRAVLRRQGPRGPQQRAAGGEPVVLPGFAPRSAPTTSRSASRTSPASAPAATRRPRPTS